MAEHRPRKRFGQHFLSDQRVLDRMISLVNPKPDSTIIEIGPGQGVLTVPLAKSGARLVAVEFDRDLIKPLEKKFSIYPNAKIVQQDFLEFEPGDALGKFILAGNIPYNITSPIIDWCVAHVDRIERAVLMVQREMGRRIAGSPNSKDWSPLSIMTQLYFEVTYEFEVPPTAFTPPPEVHSAVIGLKSRSEKPRVDIPRLDKLLRAAFKQRRKLLSNNLVPDIVPRTDELQADLSEIGARPDCRAEQLTIEQFITLTELFIQRGYL